MDTRWNSLADCIERALQLRARDPVVPQVDEACALEARQDRLRGRALRRRVRGAEEAGEVDQRDLEAVGVDGGGDGGGFHGGRGE